jgi:hypothetical protein
MYFKFWDASAEGCQIYYPFKLLQFEDDAVLIPRETAWFGYYPDGAFSPVLPPQEVIVPPCTVMS